MGKNLLALDVAAERLNKRSRSTKQSSGEVNGCYMAIQKDGWMKRKRHQHCRPMAKKCYTCSIKYVQVSESNINYTRGLKLLELSTTAESDLEMTESVVER